MNQQQAQKIIDNATEVSDGLFLFINQGQKIVDCTHFETTDNQQLFTVDVYEPKDLVNFDPVMNITYVKQDFDFDLYEKKTTTYCANRLEMRVCLVELMNSNWF